MVPGERLLRLRGNRTREEVARRAGTDWPDNRPLLAQQIYKYEAEHQPLDSILMATKLARGLGVPLSVLLTDSPVDSRIKQLCDMEEAAHKIAVEVPDAAWQQFVVEMESALAQAVAHAEGRERYRARGKKR